MARKPEGWSLIFDPRTGKWLVRWRTQDGRRVMRSTGERDRKAAQAEAARIVAAENGPARRVTRRGRTELSAHLIAEWLSDYGASHSPETTEAMETYAAAHWLPRWATVEAIDPAAYVRDRLRAVTASSVRKEASGLRALLAWLKDAGHLAEPPTVPSVPKRATGTRYEGGKRQPRRVQMDAATVRRLIDALPVKTRAGYPARDIVELIWETTLRINTIESLERPRHYRPGADVLVVSPDVDKSRYGRRLPLSPRARAILDAHATEDGPIFGRVYLRHALETAALAVDIPPDDARRVSPHDLRHAALTDLVTRPGVSLGGAAYLAGHKHVSTTSLYAHPGEEAAREALSARIGIPIRDTKRPKKKAARKRKRRKT